MGEEVRSLVFFLVLRARSRALILAHSDVFEKNEKKIKQLLFTGYLNTTVKHFDVMPIYHIQLFNLFTLPVSLLPHLRDFLFEI